jgi:hypothetical protein
VHRRKRLLESGHYGSLAEPAKTERIDRSYFGKLLRLTLLAPDLVEAILDGRPPSMRVRLRLRITFPNEWTEQHRVLDLGPSMLAHAGRSNSTDLPIIRE